MRNRVTATRQSAGENVGSSATFHLPPRQLRAAPPVPATAIIERCHMCGTEETESVAKGHVYVLVARPVAGECGVARFLEDVIDRDLWWTSLQRAGVCGVCGQLTLRRPTDQGSMMSSLRCTASVAATAHCVTLPA